MRTTRLGGSIFDLTVGLKRGLLASDAPPTTWPYCDTGFRVVRQLPGSTFGRSLRSEAVSNVEADKREVQQRQPKNPKWWATDKAPTKPAIRIYHVGYSWTDQAQRMHSVAQARAGTIHPGNTT